MFLDKREFVSLTGITNEWPEGILTGVPAPEGVDATSSYSAISAELASSLKPR